MNMRLYKKFFNLVKSGRKTVEVRRWDQKRMKLRVGDIIVFSCHEKPADSLAVVVRKMRRYPNIGSLAKEELPYSIGLDRPEQVEESLFDIYLKDGPMVAIRFRKAGDF